MVVFVAVPIGTAESALTLPAPEHWFIVLGHVPGMILLCPGNISIDRGIGYGRGIPMCHVPASEAEDEGNIVVWNWTAHDEEPAIELARR